MKLHIKFLMWELPPPPQTFSVPDQLLMLDILGTTPHVLFGAHYVLTPSGSYIWFINLSSQRQPCGHHRPVLVSVSFFFPDVFIFNWRIIALQYCIGLCHTSTRISRRYTCVPSLLNLLATSHPIPPPWLSQSP